MAVRVKICGITRLQDLQAACAAGVDAVGFVFYEQSPRHVSLEAAAELVRALPPFVQSVGLFVNAEPAFIDRVLQLVPLDLLQFHGDETPTDCARFGRPYIKAVRVNRDTDLLKYAADFDAARGLLLDAFVPGVPGGTIRPFMSTIFTSRCGWMRPTVDTRRSSGSSVELWKLTGLVSVMP